MSEANKALVREFYANVWNAHNPEATEQYVGADFVEHNPPAPGLPAGAEGAKQTFTTFLTAFPDLQISIDLQIAEGDLVMTRWTSTGTNTGSLMGMPPSGRAISVTGVDIFRVADGKLVERWGNFDSAGMMQQLGAGPA